MRKKGFTLVELLVTLTLMAIISAMLFPFIINYNEKTRLRSNHRSLKLVEGAIERYIAMREDFVLDDWTNGATKIDNASYTNYPLYPIYVIDNNKIDDIIDDLTGTSGDADAEQYVTLKGTEAYLDSDNLSIACTTYTGTNTYGAYNGYPFAVLRFREKDTGNGVDRKQRQIDEDDWDTTISTSDVTNILTPE